MVNSGNLNGVVPTSDDLEKGEGFEDGQLEDLEEGEIYDATQEGDLEKRGETYETQEPELLEPLLTPMEARHTELVAASQPFILTEKLMVSLLIIIIVLVEAYFVGRNLSQNHDLHKDGKSIDNLVFSPISLPLQSGPQVPIENVGHVKESLTTPEPVEDFLGVNSEAFTTRKGFMTTVTKMPPTRRPVVVKEAGEVVISTVRTTPMMKESISHPQALVIDDRY